MNKTNKTNTSNTISNNKKTNLPLNNYSLSNNPQKTEHGKNQQQTTKNHCSNPVHSESTFAVGSLPLVVSNKGFWFEVLGGLSHKDLIELNKIRLEVMRLKFPCEQRARPNLGRNVYRVFSDSELLEFFSAIDFRQVKAGICFFLQLTGGFRQREVSLLKFSNLSFDKGSVGLLTDKARKFSDQPLPLVALDLLSDWVSLNDERIGVSDFLFFSDNLFYSRKHISSDYLRTFFNSVRKKAGLNSAYATANDSKPKSTNQRLLYKLSNHSLRRTYLTKLYLQCKKKELVKVLARHEKKDVTDQYIFFSHEEQLELVNETFNKEPFLSIASDLKEKIRMWSEHKRK